MLGPMEGGTTVLSRRRKEAARQLAWWQRLLARLGL